METTYFSSQNWSRLFVIFQQFGYDLTKYKEEKKKVQYLWFELLDIQDEWIGDIEQVIRFNTNLCFKLDKKEAIKEVNAPLYRLHNLFEDDYFKPDKNPAPGLKKFLDSIKNIFGNLKKFNKDIKLVKRILDFFKKRHDKLLVEYYEYIKRISLPVKGFENLRMALFAILKKIDHLFTLISIPTVFDSFINDLKEFKSSYISIYVAEHNKFQREMNSFTLKLHNLEEYRVLNILSNIEVIKTSYSIKPIKKYIDDFFPQHCRENSIKNILQIRPKCSCGFVLNESLVIPSTNKIIPLLKKGISDYIYKLNNKPYFRKKLKIYFENNDNSRLNKILSADLKNIEDIYSSIDKDLIDEINTALYDTYSINISGSKILKKIEGSYYAADLTDLSSNIKKAILNILDNKFSKIEQPDKEKIIINIADD